MSKSQTGYGVKLVRGPFLTLPAHPDHCTTSQELSALVSSIRAETPGRVLAADLFSGAGGLSLGLHQAGVKVVLAVDHYKEALETHRHHFPGLTVDWDLAEPDRIEHVADMIRENAIEILVGGPPCQPFSKAGRSMIRHQVRGGLREAHDRRRDLWRSYLEVVRLSRPAAVVMENVPDMALDDEMFILRTMVHELESLGYSVSERVIETWRYGVPQFRQRLILVAMRDGKPFEWPAEAAERVTVWNAIGDLPEVVGGWRPEGGEHGWTQYGEPATSFQRRMRSGVSVGDAGKLFDHITRPVRDDDARAFELMDSSTRYSDLPAEFKRYRDDIFDDKYKRLNEDDLSRTITAHIAKDGYWYIHPRQGRTITVREAARLQTFPDWYRFAGPPSAAFKQIGNAVPPLLGEHLARAVLRSLAEAGVAATTSMEMSRRLSDWFNSRVSLGVPWLRAQSRWQAIAALTVLQRADPGQVRFLWPIIERWRTPADTISQSTELRQIAILIGKQRRYEGLLSLAEIAQRNPSLIEGPSVEAPEVQGLPEHIAGLATLVIAEVAGVEADEPVLATAGALRVASRVIGEPVDKRNRLTDGRLAIARLIGGGIEARAAHLAVLEIAATVCRPVDPLCRDCPLADVCVTSTAHQQKAQHLF